MQECWRSATAPALAHLDLRHNQIGDQGAGSLAARRLHRPSILPKKPRERERGGGAFRAFPRLSSVRAGRVSMTRSHISYAGDLIGNRNSETMKIDSGSVL